MFYIKTIAKRRAKKASLNLLWETAMPALIATVQSSYHGDKMWAYKQLIKLAREVDNHNANGCQINKMDKEIK